MNTTTRTSTAERLGRAFGRGWRAYARGERRASNWLVFRGVPRAGATALVWVFKLAVLGVLLYVAFWFALVLLGVVLTVALADLRQHLRRTRSAVVVAPPDAGAVSPVATPLPTPAASDGGLPQRADGLGN